MIRIRILHRLFGEYDYDLFPKFQHKIKLINKLQNY